MTLHLNLGSRITYGLLRQKFLSEEFVADGTQLAIAEMIKSGTTCFADMYFFHEAIAGQVRNAGIRSQIGFTVLDFATPYGKDAEGLYS